MPLKLNTQIMSRHLSTVWLTSETRIDFDAWVKLSIGFEIILHNGYNGEGSEEQRYFFALETPNESSSITYGRTLQEFIRRVEEHYQDDRMNWRVLENVEDEYYDVIKEVVRHDLKVMLDHLETTINHGWNEHTSLPLARFYRSVYRPQ